jgi:hypothetical protein
MRDFVFINRNFILHLILAFPAFHIIDALFLRVGRQDLLSQVDFAGMNAISGIGDDFYPT